VIILVN